MNLIVTKFKPIQELTQYVESYWLGKFNISGDNNFSQTVVPNGCIELIIHLSDDHCALDKDSHGYHKSPPFTLLGVYDKTYVVKFSNSVHVLGIRFYPDGFRNIIGVPPGLFTSTYEDGIDVMGKNLKELCLRIKEIESSQDKIKLINDFLLNQVMKNKRTYDNTRIAMQLIRQQMGLIGFDELKEKVPISFRQLQREFKTLYGLTISDYMRLIRLNAINKYMLSKSSTLTEIAHDLDFTDQSHFIREFRRYTGLPPGKFVRNYEDFIVNVV